MYTSGFMASGATMSIIKPSAWQKRDICETTLAWSNISLSSILAQTATASSVFSYVVYTKVYASSKTQRKKMKVMG